MQVYVSTGALLTLNNGRDYHLLPKILPQIEADGAEFMMYHLWENEEREIIRLLKACACRFPVMHTDKRIGEALSENGKAGYAEALSLLERDVHISEEIGAARLVLHLWGGPRADERFDEILPILESFQAICEKSGRELMVENIVCAQKLCAQRLWQLVQAFPNISFTYDTKMAQLRGENELLLTPEASWLLESGYIHHFHMNDTRPNLAKNGRMPTMQIGQGEVNFKMLFGLLKKYGYRGTGTVESTAVQPDGSIDYQGLNHSIRIIREGTK